MKPEDKILHVLKLLDASRSLSASDKYCYLDPHANELKSLTQIELKSILEKLESEKTLEVLKTPYDVWPDLGKENEPEVYTIKVLDGFDSYYDKIYTSARFGIKNLTHDNYYRIYAVAELINQELNISTDNTATFEADKSTTTLWKGIPEKSLSLYHIKQIYLKALGFLREVGAIQSYQLYKPSNNSTTQHFKVSVNRRKFDAAFLELILNSPTSKSSSLVKKLIIDKQSKPQPEYPDDTVAEPEQLKETIKALDETAPKRVDIHPLQPNHYHDKTGKLAVSPTVEVSIAVRGKITQTFHDEIATELEKKQQELNDRLKLLTNDNKQFQVTASYLLDLAQRADQLFKESDEGLRQKLLEYVLSNIELKDKKLSYILNDPFKTIVETKKKSLSAHNSDIWCTFTEPT
jgi:hypothetical protein